MKKWIFAGAVVAGIAVVAAAVIVAGVSNLGPIIKQAVNTEGPKITRTAVVLDDVGISLFTGKARLKGLVVGNPKGFETERAIRVAGILVDLDEKTLADDTIVIDSIEVIEPEITFEKRGDGDNVERIQRNAKQGSKAERAPDKGSAEKGGGKRIVIRNLIIKGGSVRLAVPMASGKTVSAPLPNIHLKDLGARKKGGASPGELFGAILDELRSQIMSTAVTAELNKGLAELGLSPEAVGAAAGKQLDKAGETGKAGVEAIGDGVGAVGEGVKGILGVTGD